MHTNLTLEFSDEHGSFNYVGHGKIDDIQMTLKELKIFKGEESLGGEEHYWNQRFEFIRSIGNSFPLFKTVLQTVFTPNGIPVSPLPRFTECTGLNPVDAVIEIKDGFFRMGYNFDI